MAFQFVTKKSGVPAGCGKAFDVEGHKVALFNLNGDFYAIDDICTHEEASLADGAITDAGNVECPWHGAMFSIKTGAALTMPAVTAVRTYAVKLEGDGVLVDVTAQLPTNPGRVSASGAPSAGVSDAGRVSASGAPSAGVSDAGRVSASGAPSAGVSDAGRVSASGAPSAGVSDAGG